MNLVFLATCYSSPPHAHLYARASHFASQSPRDAACLSPRAWTKLQLQVPTVAAVARSWPANHVDEREADVLKILSLLVPAAVLMEHGCQVLIRPCLVCAKIQKVLKILRHIAYAGTCMEY
jgi:hypothetical protein